MAGRVKFDSIIDLVEYVSTCAVHGCTNKCQPGMVCEEHLDKGFGRPLSCPICGDRPERWGLCHKCSQRLWLARKGGPAVIRPGWRISKTCVVPGCEKDSMKSDPYPLCAGHREVAECWESGDSSGAYQVAIRLLEIKPKKLCGVDGCLRPVARLGVCSPHYLEFLKEEHEWLKGKPRGFSWGAIMKSKAQAKARREQEEEECQQA